MLTTVHATDLTRDPACVEYLAPSFWISLEQATPSE
jgi:hypothetical protein